MQSWIHDMTKSGKTLPALQMAILETVVDVNFDATDRDLRLAGNHSSGSDLLSRKYKSLGQSATALVVLLSPWESSRLIIRPRQEHGE